MKYAKWKAVEVDRCLKNGITPTPGPPGGSDEDEGFGNEQGAFGGIGFNVQPPQPNTSYPPPPSSISYPPPVANPYPPNDTPRDVEKPVPKPRHNIEPESQSYPTPSATSGPNLGPAEIAKAQKLCKFAGSALEYEDIPGAIEFLEQAITLLKTGSGQ